jgi:hypothetical protein
MTNHEWIKSLTPDEFAKQFIFCPRDFAEEPVCCSDKKDFDSGDRGIVSCKTCRVTWIAGKKNDQEDEVITHEIKIYPRYFEAVMSGDKTFELRRNDRDYKVGDVILLEEFEYEVGGSYTGRNLSVTISYILKEEDGKGWIGLRPGYCCIGFKPLEDK